jgi:hypothetical protein
MVTAKYLTAAGVTAAGSDLVMHLCTSFLHV